MERSELVNAARELNAALGLKPQIDLDWSDELLALALKKVSKLVVPSDRLTDDTWRVLLRLGELPPEVVKAKAHLLDYVRTAPAMTEAETTRHVEQEVSNEETQAQTEETVAQVIEEVAVKPKKQGRRSPLIAFLEEKIAEGKYTPKEIAAMAAEKFPEYRRNTITSIIAGARAPGQCRFKYVAAFDDQGRLRFTKFLRDELRRQGIRSTEEFRQFLAGYEGDPFVAE